MFEVKWKSGDVTWLRYAEVKHLEPLKYYLEAMGVTKIAQSGQGSGARPDFDEDVRAATVRIYPRNGGRGRVNKVSVVNKRRTGLNSGRRTVQRAAQNSSLSQISIDTRYTAKEALAWETYDNDYIAFIKKEKGHPGPVPPGYVEAYMTRHPKAPHPSKYPALEAEWANRHATGECWSCGATAHDPDAGDCEAPVQRKQGTGVFLPNDAFSTLLNHQALMTHQVGQLACVHKVAPTAPRAMMRFQAKSYGVRAKFHEPKARLVPASGWKRRQVNKAAEKGKGKGRKGKGKWGRARMAAVKTDR
ncbi:hypothetical protein FB451DRAFT_1571571 [Mycena latifolia]|nr:hypothetical protein FB451DRAFT_1571571 [Mycena latifolia]